MIYDIIHKTTNEIRSGQWDSEYLNFVSSSGNVGWEVYHHWQPCEKPVMKLKTIISKVILSIHNPYFFIDTKFVNVNGSKIDISVPFKLLRFTRQYLVLKPIVGRLSFERCSFHGKVYGRKLRVYQLQSPDSDRKVAEFLVLQDKICGVCLGIDQHICYKCSK